jgi:hypothetical protein
MERVEHFQTVQDLRSACDRKLQMTADVLAQKNMAEQKNNKLSCRTCEQWSIQASGDVFDL